MNVFVINRHSVTNIPVRGVFCLHNIHDTFDSVAISTNTVMSMEWPQSKRRVVAGSTILWIVCQEGEVLKLQLYWARFRCGWEFVANLCQVEGEAITNVISCGWFHPNYSPWGHGLGQIEDWRQKKGCRKGSQSKALIDRPMHQVLHQVKLPHNSKIQVWAGRYQLDSFRQQDWFPRECMRREQTLDETDVNARFNCIVEFTTHHPTREWWFQTHWHPCALSQISAMLPKCQGCDSEDDRCNVQHF